MIPNLNPKMNNNFNFMPNMGNNIDIIQQQMMQQQMIMQQQQMMQQMMQQQMMQQMMQQQMMVQNPQQMIEEEMKRKKEEEMKRKKEEEIRNINNYFDSKLYEIDFKRINKQNESFLKIKEKLMTHIQTLQRCINNNDKIKNNYLSEPNNKINYENLLKLSSSIEDIYEDTLKEFELYKNEIRILYKQRIDELKNNYLSDFNKKYKSYIRDSNYISFTSYPFRLDEVKFKELCRINFKNIYILELKFEDDIDIKALTKANYRNLISLLLIGKIKDINILSKLPFKSLNKLLLSENNFYGTNIDIFRKVPFINLNNLILTSNKINNIEGLSKAPFYELIDLNLGFNSINDIKPIEKFPFKKLERLNLDNNEIENLEYLFKAPFCNLKHLSLGGNKISNINFFSKAKFNQLESLDLDNNKISDIEVFSKVPFNKLTQLHLSENLISNIDVFNRVPFINLGVLKIGNNKFNNFGALFYSPFKGFLNIYVDRIKYALVQNRNLELLNMNKNRIKFKIE